MRRRKFLELLGLGSVAAALTPLLKTEKLPDNKLIVWDSLSAFGVDRATGKDHISAIVYNVETVNFDSYSIVNKPVNRHCWIAQDDKDLEDLEDYIGTIGSIKLKNK